jgi:archaetidylinositol phosphate synthase
MFSFLKSKITDFLNPLTSILFKVGIKPNHITIIGLFTGFLSAYLIATKNILYGGLTILLSGFFDMLDGALARNQTLTTKFGGFLDSVFDRYVDVAIFLSLGIYGVDWVYVVLAMSGALLVSYTRARAEKIIEKCDVGIAERGERLIIIFLGIVTNYLVEAVIIVAILSHFTAIQRIHYTRKLLNEGFKT